MTVGPRFLDEEGPVASAMQPAAIAAATTPLERLTRPVLFNEEPGALDSLPDLPAATEQRAPPVGTGTGLLIAWGIGGLLTSWAVFSLLSFVAAQLQTSLVLGVLFAVCFTASAGVITWAVVAELRAWRALAEVDHLRRVMSSSLTEQSAMLAAGREWLRHVALYLTDTPQIEAALQSASSTAEVRALLRTRVADPLEAKALRLGQRAAMECAALIAVSPHKSWDGLIAGARGLQLIRQVAALYGLRPGFAVTVSMARHVAWTAAGTAGMTALAENLMSAASEAPILRYVAGAMGGSAVEAIRIIRLARVAARSCCPLDT